MNALIVYAHPEPQSFGAGMLSVAMDALTDAGHTVVVSDLYAESFSAAAGPEDFIDRLDPDTLNLGAEQEHAAKNECFAGDIQREIDRLFAADLLILQLPLWWYSVPAIMKGWIDRVFAYGVTYDFGRTWDRGIMQGKRAMLAFTTGAPASRRTPTTRASCPSTAWCSSERPSPERSSSDAPRAIQCSTSRTRPASIARRSSMSASRTTVPLTSSSTLAKAGRAAQLYRGSISSPWRHRRCAR